MAQIHPYINFNGNCEVAFAFYKSVFGGEFNGVNRFNEMPPEQSLPPEYGEKIMHMSLPIGNGALLMGSDAVEGFGDPHLVGNNMQIYVGADSKEQADQVFNGLAANGKITMPIGMTFWGSYFGALVDQFGIGWMVSFDEPQPA